MSEIINGLYLGGASSAQNPKFQNILNVASEIRRATEHDGDHYLHIRLRDSESENIKQHFPNTFSFIDKCLNRGENVLVHCAAGISRSATIVIAYLMKKYTWSAEYATNFTLSKRDVIDPNFNFRYQLLSYEVDLGIKNGCIGM